MEQEGGFKYPSENLHGPSSVARCGKVIDVGLFLFGVGSHKVSHLNNRSVPMVIQKISTLLLE